MNEAFKIYVDQLKEGHEEEIQEELSPDFIDINEKDLSFKDLVNLEGKAYLAEDSLILNFDISTYATLSCAVCNSPVRVKVSIENFYHAEPLTEIKSGIYNIQPLLRETILIETPKFAECNQGKCIEREKISKYLKNPQSKEGHSEGIDPREEEGYRPFSNLELE